MLMCGRFSLYASPEEVKETFSLAHSPQISPQYNIAPGAIATSVCLHPNHQYEAHYFKWGLIPHWAKDEKIAYHCFNARAETVHQKPAFRQAFKERRCLIIMNGFYEWKQQNGVKQPYYIEVNGGAPFAVAGIWEYWRNPVGNIIKTCSIITTTANDKLSWLHDRMPVILDAKDYLCYLDIQSFQIDELRALLIPYSKSDALSCHRVSMKVNKTSYQDNDAIRPIPPVST